MFHAVWKQLSLQADALLCINVEAKRCAVLFSVVQVAVMLVMSGTEASGP